MIWLIPTFAGFALVLFLAQGFVRHPCWRAGGHDYLNYERGMTEPLVCAREGCGKTLARVHENCGTVHDPHVLLTICSVTRTVDWGDK